MGDIRKLRKQYSKPSHPFEGPRILEELEYLGRFGLRNKKEFWRHKGQLGRYRKLARYARTLPQDRAKAFTADISGHLYHLGLISEDGSIDAILSLKIENFLERRLQTIIYKKGYAKTISQARQLVTHGHISINGQKITTPSYLVGRDEEDKIEFFYRSPFLSNRAKIWGSESDAAQALKDSAEGEGSDEDQDRRKDRKPRRKREE